MNDFLSSSVESVVQCWGCEVFDRLFQIVSDAAALAYTKLTTLAVVIFCVIFAFFVISAFWKNISGGVKDVFYEKSIQKVVINGLVAMGLLSLGVALPRFITTVTFEPVTQIARIYTQSMVGMDTAAVEEKVTYQPREISDNGFYRPQLRDQVILLMKTTITQFQAYMKLGIAVMENAITWRAIVPPSNLIKHLLLFFVGLYMVIGFFKLFFKYCCYFADIIIAMAYFAFFFPFSLALVAFKGAEHVPEWVGKLGQNVGVHQFKNLINSIVALASATITFTIVMVVVAKFFSAPDQSSVSLMEQITTGKILEADLNTDNLAAISLVGCAVLVYVLNYIFDQTKKVTGMILECFGVGEEKQHGEQLANDVMKLASTAFSGINKAAQTVAGVGKDAVIKDDDKKKDSK